MDEITRSLIASTCLGLKAIAARVEQETKDAIASGNHLTVLRHYVDLDEANDELREPLKAVTAIVNTLNYNQIPELMKSLGVKSTKLDGVGLVTVAYKWSATILDDQKEAAIAWLRANGLGGIVTETVNAQTLSSTAKGLSDEKGIDLPAEIFKSGPKPYTSIKRTK